MSFFEKLKERWGITSNWRFIKILIIFSLTGMCAVQIRKLIFPFLGIGTDTPTWLYILLWLVLITPAYYFFMVIFSILLGEKDFFFAVMGKTFSRFKKKKSIDQKWFNFIGIRSILNYKEIIKNPVTLISVTGFFIISSIGFRLQNWFRKHNNFIV